MKSITHSTFMSARDWHIRRSGFRENASRIPARFIPPAQLREMRRRDQVAAVCFRIRNRKIEFLLVQTRGGRWTFPKGGAEAGLTPAQAAALEAFEEAGVHGRIEEARFASYVCKKRGARGSGARDVVVSAHLCEVLWLGPPEESGRNPSWFTPEKAKRRLREDRNGSDGEQFARVVDRAVTRIRRLSSGMPITIDALRKVDLTRRPSKRNFSGNRLFIVPSKAHKSW
jgi:8-oxo-dGTP pyrophosphatase MutT (NUDIX family)